MFVRPYLAGMPIFVTIGQFIQKNYCEVLQVRGGGVVEGKRAKLIVTEKDLLLYTC